VYRENQFRYGVPPWQREIRRVLKGHGFSRAANVAKYAQGFSP
jgi:hypothetical protein